MTVLLCGRKMSEFNESLKLTRVEFSSFFLHPDLSCMSVAVNPLWERAGFLKKREKMSFLCFSLAGGICIVSKARGLSLSSWGWSLCVLLVWLPDLQLNALVSFCLRLVHYSCSFHRVRFWPQILEAPLFSEAEIGKCRLVCLTYILFKIKSILESSIYLLLCIKEI